MASMTLKSSTRTKRRRRTTEGVKECIEWNRMESSGMNASGMSARMIDNTDETEELSRGMTDDDGADVEREMCNVVDDDERVRGQKKAMASQRDARCAPGSRRERARARGDRAGRMRARARA